MPSSVILLDKAVGLSSAQAIAQVKRKLSLEKIGHAGTLDPFATGLLVCFTGAATRLVSYAMQGRKKYSGVFRLGYETNTEDCAGKMVGEKISDDLLPGIETVLQAGKPFVGKISQVPPQVSALKVDGKRAYDRARDGEVFEMVAREVEVFAVEIATTNTAHEYLITVECGAGTYIRSIVRDIGRALKCGATLMTLRREASAPFSISEAHTIDTLEPTHALTWPNAVSHLPCIAVPHYVGSSLMQGKQRALAEFGALKAVRELAAESAQVVYLIEGSPTSGGILGRDADKWRVLINLPE